MQNRKGFTLIELLIVVVIIGILAAIAIPKFATTKDKAKLASIKTDLRNAGADWVDQELVEAVSDAGGFIITSRHPGDLPAFCEVLLRHLK